GGLMDRALRPSVDQREEVAAPLPTRRIYYVRVRRVERDVGDAGVLADAQDGLPRLAAVGGLVQAAITARRPERPLRGAANDFAGDRVIHLAADVLGFFEAALGEAPSTVLGFVYAVAIADAALAVAFACADPERRGVLRTERDRANRIRAVIVEDRRPGGSG